MKKLVSVMLCICFIALCFFGCGNSENDSNSNAEIKSTYDSAYSSFDASTIRAYSSFCEAVIGYQTDVRLNVGMFDDIQQLFYTSCPLNILVKDITVNKDGSGLSVEYKNDEATHKQIVSDFSDKIVSIQEKCSAVNDAVFVINAYNYVASSIEPGDNSATTCYDTIMNGGGTEFTYSGMFEYILQQHGIPAYHILCEDAYGASKAMSAAVVNGNLYYFDVMSEYYANGGNQLLFFGMTTDDVIGMGYTNLIYTNREIAEDSSDLTFEACRFCSEWTVEGNNLIITKNDDEIVRIAL